MFALHSSENLAALICKVQIELCPYEASADHYPWGSKCSDTNLRMFLHDPEQLQSLNREGLKIGEAEVAPRHRIVERDGRGVKGGKDLGVSRPEVLGRRPDSPQLGSPVPEPHRRSGGPKRLLRL